MPIRPERRIIAAVPAPVGSGNPDRGVSEVNINLEKIELVPLAKSAIERDNGCWLRIKADTGMISGSQSCREAYGLNHVRHTHVYLYIVRVDGGWVIGLQGTEDDTAISTARITYNTDAKTRKVAGFSIRAKAFLAQARFCVNKDVKIDFAPSDMLDKDNVKLLYVSDARLEGHVVPPVDDDSSPDPA